MKKILRIKTIYITLLITLVMLLSSCAQTEKKPEQQPVDKQAQTNTVNDAEKAKDFVGEFIVEPSYVIEKLADENVIFIDARGEENAKKGTIPNAIALKWQLLADVSAKPGEEGFGTILPKEKLQAALESFGVDSSKEIIILSDADKGWGDDGRILWTLRMAGFKNIKMVNGGIKALTEEGLTVSKDIAVLEPVKLQIDNIDESYNITTQELTTNLEKYKVIDTRAKEEYEGATKYGEAKGGHIPNSINIDFVELFNSKGKLKTNDEIVDLLTQKGINKEDAIVTYCTAGIRSAYMQTILDMCGYKNVKNYDESYYRWCAINEVEK